MLLKFNEDLDLQTTIEVNPHIYYLLKSMLP